MPSYDEQGRLLGEYDGGGHLIQETVWLEDAIIQWLGNLECPHEISLSSQAVIGRACSILL